MRTLLRNKRQDAIFGAVFGIVAITAATNASVRAQSLAPVVAGGVAGFSDMLTPSNSDDFRSYGGGLYIHNNAWSAFSSSQKSSVLGIYSGQGPQTVELGYSDNAYAWADIYTSGYAPSGVTGSMVAFNGIGANYQAYMDEMRRRGPSNILYVYSPNDTTTWQTAFSDPAFNTLRTQWTYGGGITTDAPPAFYFAMPQGYRTWVQNEIQWSNSLGLTSLCIISPHDSGTNFLTDAANYVLDLETHNAIPTDWSVENYVDPTPPGYVNGVGSEDVSYNIMGVADWLIHHVQGVPGSLNLYASRTVASTTTNYGKGTFSSYYGTTAKQVPIPAHPSLSPITYTLNLANLNTNATTGWYVPNLLAQTQGSSANWTISIKLGSTDITSSVLSSTGYSMTGNVLQANSTNPLTVTLTPSSTAASPFTLSFFLKADPNATRRADMISFQEQTLLWDGTSSNWSAGTHWQGQAWNSGYGAVISSGTATVDSTTTNSIESFIDLNTGGTLNGTGFAHLQNPTFAGGTLSGSSPDPVKGGWSLDSSVTVNGGVTSTINAAQVSLANTARSFNIDPASTLLVTGTFVNGQGVTGGLSLKGGGTMVLQGANTYTGATSISSGLLMLENISAVAASAGISVSATGKIELLAGTDNLTFASVPLTLNGAAGFGMDSGSTLRTATWPGAITLTAGANASIRQFGIDHHSATLNLTGVLSGSGGFTLNSSELAVKLSNTGNNYTGPTNVNAGKLQISTAAALPPASAVTVSGGQLYLPVAGTFNNALALAGSNDNEALDPAAGAGAVRFNVNGGTWNLGGPITIGGEGTAGVTEIATYSSSSTINLSGPIGGTGPLVLGAGGAAVTHLHTFVLSGASNYTGSTTLLSNAAGITVKLSGGANRLPVTTDLILQSGSLSGAATRGWLDLNGNNQQLASISIHAGIGGTGDNRIGNSSATPATLTIANSSSDQFDGVLGGGPGNNFSLAASGSGVLTLTAANTYGGSTLVNSGTLDVAGSLLSPTVTVGTSATLIVESAGDIASNTTLVANGVISFAARAPGSGILPRNLTSLSLGSGSHVSIADPASHSDRTLLCTSGLTFIGSANAWSGQLDLAGNDLIVHGGVLATITNQIKTGYAQGAFTGSGITASTAKNDAAHLTTLGVLLNNNGASTSIYSSFDGHTAGPNDVLVKYTYYGDANLDGSVNSSDYSQIDNGFNSGGTGWYSGDFNYDGTVNSSDYSLIDNAFNQTQGMSLSTPATITSLFAAPTSVVSVPEPAMSFVLTAACLGLLPRRNRRR